MLDLNAFLLNPLLIYYYNQLTSDFEMALVLEPINSLVKADLLLVQNLIKDRDCDLKGENKKEKKPRRRRIQIEEVGVLGGALTQAVAAEEITSFTTSVNEVPSLAMITPIMETSLTSPNVIAKTDEKIPNQSLSPSKLTTGLSFAQKADAIVDSSAGPSIMLETSIKTFNNDAIVPPATLFDFEREWKNRKDNPREMYMYFKAVPTSIFPTLFKNSLDAQYLTTMIQLIHDFYLEYCVH